MNIKIQVDKEKIADFCKRNKIASFSIFGSALRDDFGPESDIDVLVEFAPDSHVGLFELYDLEQELKEVFGGRNVDLNTVKSLSKYFRDDVIQEAQVQYVQK